MIAMEAGRPETPVARAWPDGALSRVPYWVYQDPDLHREEQRRLFEGAVWSFLCLEAEIPHAGDYRSTFVGTMPVIVVRDQEGAIRAFENRCVHRGALIALEDGGNVRTFECVYHNWTYDLEGNLKSIAFRRGANGRGGMPETFCMEAHGPRKLRTTALCGLVFGTLSPDTPPIEDYLGPEVLARLRRVLRKPVQILGKFTQALPNNWKLYVENVKDTYHASLLHTFLTTFRITRLSGPGGVVVSESGGHHASASYSPPQANSYRAQALRADNEHLRLADASLLDTVDEFGDGIPVQLLGVFPAFILQQIHNSLAVRQVLPKGIGATDLNWTYIGFTDDTPEMRRRRLKQSNLIGPAGLVSMEDGCVGGFVQRGIAAAGDEEAIVEMGGHGAESQDTRTTEASVRGFWKQYRAHMGL